jgi:hypothetical protein
MLSAHLSRVLPTDFFHEIFSPVIFHYSRFVHSDYMTSPLQPHELNIFHCIRSIQQFTHS